MKTVGVILARGGSKGIPRKNLLDLNSQPLISYTINALQKSNVDETWVSTEDDEIASVSESLGANVLRRPIELADDIIMPDPALVHFAENVDFDVLVFIQPTSPLLEAKYINEGLEKMVEYDSVFSVYKEHWLPRWSLDNQPINWNIYNRPRRQDMKEEYVENGAFYINRRKNLLESKLRYSGNIGMVEMPMERSFQIDSFSDVKLIEKLL